MIINGVTIDATFAEAFPMKATRAIITAQNEKWAMISAQAMTGFATSVIACGCEGVNDAETLPVEVIGKAAQVIVHKILLLTAKDLCLPVTDKRVASETRARILHRGIAMANLSV